MSPARRTALILSARRGWLPAGFTELEYLASSGTQRILTGIDPDQETGWTITCQRVGSGLCFPMGLWRNVSGKTIRYSSFYPDSKGARYLAFAYNAMQPIAYDVGAEIVSSKLYSAVNWKNNSIATCRTTEENAQFSLQEDLELSYFGKTGIDMPIFARGEGAPNTFSYFSVKIFQMKISQGEEVVRDFVPVLDADGTPCMFDKISKTCFYNSGSGTFGYRVKTTGEESAPFSLRDPYYTAPSGVYARPSGENQLEILADTEEPTGDGWEWFANTAEAYEHFGITQEELSTTAQTND